VSLRRRRQAVEPRQRVDQDVGSERREPCRQISGGFLRADHRRCGQENRARVHSRVHLKRGDPGHGLAAHDGPLDRRGAAIARQQRAVDVDRATPGGVEYGLRQDLAERGDDRHVGAERPKTVGPLGVAQAGRLQDLESGRQRARLDGRRGQTLAAVRRSVRLRDDGDDVMVTQHGLESRQGERGRAVEENSQTGRHDNTKLSTRARNVSG
jgi:hypothetical protein